MIKINLEEWKQQIFFKQIIILKDQELLPEIEKNYYKMVCIDSQKLLVMQLVSKIQYSEELKLEIFKLRKAKREHKLKTRQALQEKIKKGLLSEKMYNLIIFNFYVKISNF